MIRLDLSKCKAFTKTQLFQITQIMSGHLLWFSGQQVSYFLLKIKRHVRSFTLVFGSASLLFFISDKATCSLVAIRNKCSASAGYALTRDVDI